MTCYVMDLLVLQHTMTGPVKRKPWFSSAPLHIQTGVHKPTKYTCKHTYMRTHTHIHTHTYIHAHIHTSWLMCRFKHTYIHTNTHAHTHTYCTYIWMQCTHTYRHANFLACATDLMTKMRNRFSSSQSTDNPWQVRSTVQSFFTDE